MLTNCYSFIHFLALQTPTEIDDYVHRIGRTGRCGNQGRAIAFFDQSQPEDIKLALDLCKQMQQCETEDIPPWLMEMAGVTGGMRGGGGGSGGLNNRQDLRGKIPAAAAAASSRGKDDDEDWE